MKIASVADVKAKLSAYVKESSRGPVVITRNGKVVAAIIHLEDDDDVERFMLGHSPKFRQILLSARKRIRGGAKISHDEFWKDVNVVKRPKRRRKAA